MPGSYKSDRQHALETLDMIATLLTEIECRSKTLMSSVTLLQQVVRPGGRVYALLVTYNGAQALGGLKNFLNLLYNSLPATNSGAKATTWFDQAGVLLEAVIVGLLELSQAPTSAELADASGNILDLAEEGLACVMRDLPDQLEAVEGSTDRTMLELSFTRHLSRHTLDLLLPTLRSLARKVEQLKFSHVAALSGTAAQPVLDWIGHIYVLLLGCVRRRGYFAPSGDDADALLLAAKLARLRDQAATLLSSTPAYALLRDGIRTEAPPPYVDLRPATGEAGAAGRVGEEVATAQLAGRDVAATPRRSRAATL